MGPLTFLARKKEGSVDSGSFILGFTTTWRRFTHAGYHQDSREQCLGKPVNIYTRLSILTQHGISPVTVLNVILQTFCYPDSSWSGRGIHLQVGTKGTGRSVDRVFVSVPWPALSPLFLILSCMWPWHNPSNRQVQLSSFLPGTRFFISSDEKERDFLRPCLTHKCFFLIS